MRMLLFVITGCTLIGMFVFARWLVGTKYGRVLQAIRDAESRVMHLARVQLGVDRHAAAPAAVELRAGGHEVETAVDRAAVAERGRALREQSVRIHAGPAVRVTPSASRRSIAAGS